MHTVGGVAFLMRLHAEQVDLVEDFDLDNQVDVLVSPAVQLPHVIDNR